MTVAPVEAPLDAIGIAALLGKADVPSAEQVAATQAPLEPLLVVAGAGSGKTETMAARVVHLVANGQVAPDRVLGLTFTRKAAGELSQRVRDRLRALERALRADGRRPVWAQDDQGTAFVVPTISTYNAYAAGLVADHALRIGVEPSARLLSEAARWQLAHDVVEHWSVDLGVDSAPSTITKAVLSLAGELSEHLVPPAELRSSAEELVELIAAVPHGSPGATPLSKHLVPVAEVAASLSLRVSLVDLVVEFTARKREADVIDFADQVALAARLAREVPEVGAGERARFGVVLLDEYQDTSVAQLVLLRHLFGDRASGGPGHPVTAVGDPHQSIYGWRGASAGGLERFPVEFPRCDGSPADQLTLSTSWRNDRAVLGVANRVAAPLRERATIALPELVARPSAGPGEVAAQFLETAQDEAVAVAQFVAAHRTRLTAERAVAAETASDGHRGARRSRTPVAPVTAAVLCRKRAQFPLLHAALLAEGLPVEVVGLGGLLTTPEVVDLVAALEAAHDPSRGDSLMRLLTGPRARLGLADLHALAEWSAELAHRTGLPGPAPARGPGPVAEPDPIDERSIVDALDDPPPMAWESRTGRRLSPTGRARLADLAGVLRSLRSQTFLPVVDLVVEAERLLGLDIEVAVSRARDGGDAGHAGGAGYDVGAARAHLDAFRSVAAAFGDGSDSGTLGAFLAWLDAAVQEERGLEAPVTEVDPHAVQILTVHAAKGLEWDVVAVPGLVAGTFPTAARSWGWIKENGALPTSLRGDRADLPTFRVDGAGDVAELAARIAAFRDDHEEHHLREERRLAYVAFTRAKSHLLLTGSWWRGGARPVDPSVFLLEGLAASVDADHAVHRGRWALDPRTPDENGIVRRPTPPSPPEQPPVLWPSPQVYDDDRHVRLGRAAAAVRTAWAELGSLTGPVDEHPGRARRSPLEDVADLLLEERRRGRAERSDVALPAHLSASAVVRLAADPAGFALQLRRPVPLEPSTRARRGTSFHAWVERYYGAATLVDVDAMPGADDDSVGGDVGLITLQQAFLASPWAGRSPLAVEVDIETPVAGVVLRSRIDAVFAEGDGVVVVDWKTGRPPSDPVVLRTREIQLAVYRLAWSRWKGVPLDTVQAAFFYVGSGQTVRPERLLDPQEIEDLVGLDAAGHRT